MKERPILFSGPMVKAILAGTKTQTRRILKVSHIPGDVRTLRFENQTAEELAHVAKCPYGEPGDRLWVRESFAIGPKDHGWGHVIYKATHSAGMNPLCEGFTPWKPSIHMPRWASRITLKIVGVRVQRVQEISEVDAKAEGLEFMEPNRFAPPGGKYWMPHYAAFQSLWDFVNGPGAWERNDWVWALSLSVMARGVACI